MKPKKFLFFPIAALALLAWSLPVWAPVPKLAIVVSAASPLQNIAMKDLKDAFLLEVLEVPGTSARLKFFAMPDQSPAHKIALSAIYKMSAADLKRLWLKKVFQNTIVSEPSSVSGSAELGQMLARETGGIGYCLDSEIPAGVRAVKVDGKSTEDAEYPLAE